MKSIITILLLGVLISPVHSDSSFFLDQKGTWEKLGSRKVNFKVDKDVVSVTGREGKFRKIKLVVERGSINFHKCTVVFGDGSRQKVNLKKVIHQGQSTRVIDLKGGRRVIKEVIFVYDTKNYEGKKAKVELWGLH